MTDPDQAPGALLEAAWQALDAGDIEHAEDAAAAAAARLPDSIEVLSLQAAIALSRGELDEAIGLCERAIETDESDPRPYIQWAELCLYSADDERAIELAVSAIDRAGDESDFVDALLIKAAAELGCERDEEARRTLRELDACVIKEPPLLYRTGELWLELEEPKLAQRAFESCLAGEPSSADAHYGMGLALEELGDRDGMLRSWRRVRELDSRAKAPTWHLSEDSFGEVVAGAITNLPRKLRAALEGVQILVLAAPSGADVEAGTDPRLLGRFEGTPASHTLASPRPHVESIIVYQRNLERASGSRTELDEEVRQTLIHEYAQFFDLTEEQLEALGV